MKHDEETIGLAAALDIGDTTPEKRLLVAVALDAITGARQGAQEDQYWLLSDPHGERISFAYVCDVLGINRQAVRQAIVRQGAGHWLRIPIPEDLVSAVEDKGTDRVVRPVPAAPPWAPDGVPVPHGTCARCTHPTRHHGNAGRCGDPECLCPQAVNGDGCGLCRCGELSYAGPASTWRLCPECKRALERPAQSDLTAAPKPPETLTAPPAGVTKPCPGHHGKPVCMVSIPATAERCDACVAGFVPAPTRPVLTLVKARRPEPESSSTGQVADLRNLAKRPAMLDSPGPRRCQGVAERERANCRAELPPPVRVGGRPRRFCDDCARARELVTKTARRRLAGVQPRSITATTTQPEVAMGADAKRCIGVEGTARDGCRALLPKYGEPGFHGRRLFCDACTTVRQTRRMTPAAAEGLKRCRGVPGTPTASCPATVSATAPDGLCAVCREVATARLRRGESSPLKPPSEGIKSTNKSTNKKHDITPRSATTPRPAAASAAAGDGGKTRTPYVKDTTLPGVIQNIRAGREAVQLQIAALEDELSELRLRDTKLGEALASLEAIGAA